MTRGEADDSPAARPPAPRGRCHHRGGRTFRPRGSAVVVSPEGFALFAPLPGDRWILFGTGHHMLVFGAAPAGLSRFETEWKGVVEVADAGVRRLDPARAGVPGGGLVLVRPDGFLGFRAIPATDAGLDAIAAHLSTYLDPARL